VNCEQTPPLPDDRRSQAPPNQREPEVEGSPEPAGAGYAEGELLRPPVGGEWLTGHGQPGTRTSVAEAPVLRRERHHREATRRRRRRSHRMVVLFDDEEFEDVSRAAMASGLTESGWTANSALAVARSQPPPGSGVARQLLLELMAARTQVRRVGVNLNQAVAAQNATGEPPPWLVSAVEVTERTVTRLYEAAMALTSRSGEQRQVDRGAAGAVRLASAARSAR
jgi:hypothetical protein